VGLMFLGNLSQVEGLVGLALAVGHSIKDLVLFIIYIQDLIKYLSNFISTFIFIRFRDLEAIIKTKS
jgi:hypothetical protein